MGKCCPNVAPNPKDDSFSEKCEKIIDSFIKCIVWVYNTIKLEDDKCDSTPPLNET